MPDPKPSEMNLHSEMPSRAFDLGAYPKGILSPRRVMLCHPNTKSL
jgi:hypothetical protein